MKKWILFITLSSSLLSAIDPWYSEKKRGWYYFEENKEAEYKSSESISSQPATLETAQNIIDNLKEKTQKYLNLALVNPTVQNVANYLKHQKKLMDQSARFASTWQAALLSHPELAYDLPRTDYGQLIMKAQEEHTREERLDQIKKEHFLLFVFEGGSVYSREVGSVVADLASRKNWKVQGVSSDGISLEQFDRAHLDQGLVEMLGVKKTPSLYLVHPEKDYIVPIGSGLMDHETIEKNIDFQMLRKGDHHHAL